MDRKLGKVSEAETPATAPGTEHSPYARFFRILGDPTRLAIVQLLLTRPYSVTELVKELGVSQSRVSNHLACLRWCHVAAAERRGRRVVYTITDSRLRRLLDLASELVPDDPEQSEDYRRIGPDWI